MSLRSTERSDEVVVGEARWHMAGAVLADGPHDSSAR
jgi:hypothetical protein